MEQWEYTSLLFHDPIFSDKDWEQFVILLNTWGEQGWQLVQLINRGGSGTYVAIFKRRKLEEPPNGETE